MPLARGRVLRGDAERYTIQPRIGFLAHRPAQLAESHISDGVAGQEIDVAAFVRRIALGLDEIRREDDVAMGIVDGEHAFGTDRANLEAVDRPGPDLRERPRNHAV